MKRNERAIHQMIIGIIIFISQISLVSADSVNSVAEIYLDDTSTIVSSGGEGFGGGVWYYYPSEDYYIQWFYNGNYNTSMQVEFYYNIHVRVLDATKSLDAYIYYCWSTELWAQTGRFVPPIPSYTEGSSQEYFRLNDKCIYETEDSHYSVNSLHGYSQTQYIEEYNPQWIGIVIRGKNIKVDSYLEHTTIKKDSTSSDYTPSVTGASCNRVTGACYVAPEGSNMSPFVWLGAYTTCEDCQVSAIQYDFGDAPSTYMTTLQNNGARHTILAGYKLGSTITGESDGQPGPGASLDQDDGIEWLTNPVQGQTAAVRISASNSGIINAWIDFNRDGDWADAGEQILIDEPVAAGSNDFGYVVPGGASIGDTYARFRFSTSTGLSYVGLAPDGEVEDWRLTILSASNPDPGPGPDPIPDPHYTPQDPSLQISTLCGQAPQEGSGVNFYTGSSVSSFYYTGPIVADDWTDSTGDPVIGFKWWGTFSDWSYTYPPAALPDVFHIGIWTNYTGIDQPSMLIWETYSNTWTWGFLGYVQDSSSSYGQRSVFEFIQLLSQDQWFTPTLGTGEKYWISVSAYYSSGSSENTWAWFKRSNSDQASAVRITKLSNSATWPPEPYDYVSISTVIKEGTDMAFELLGKGECSGSSGTDGFHPYDLNKDGVVDMQDSWILMHYVLD